jgi:hypothetical protein
LIVGRVPAGPRLTPAEAQAQILAGEAPARLRVGGSLDLAGHPALAALPPGLQANNLNLRGCSGLRTLPPDLRVRFRLDLTGCTGLERLPQGLAAGILILRDCVNLRALPEGLSTSFLDISGCTGLAGWPATGSVQAGRLDVSRCPQIRTLPPWLTELAQLDVHGCLSLATLPPGLRVTAWIDLANTALTALPPSIDGAQLRWRGVPIDARIAFHPETLTAREVLEEPNVERRRVMLERMGYAAFLERAGATVLDEDEDIGGARRLLRIDLTGDEPLVCVSLLCPSTGRQYVLRVPPTMQTCRQAVAWMAGYDNPDDYRPLVET